MNVKRIIIISLALVFAVSSLSVVSAGFLDGLFGSAQNNVTDIDGFQFNIPDGFKPVNDKNYENRYSMAYIPDYQRSLSYHKPDMMIIFNNTSSFPQGNSIPAGNFFTAMDDDFILSDQSSQNYSRIHNDTAMNYVNSADNKTFEILIEHPTQGKEISSDAVKPNKTINGIEGEFKQNSDRAEFKYFKGDSLIHILAPDEGLISNIVVNK